MKVLPSGLTQDEKELAVETAISDLFFNMDHGEYRQMTQDEDAGFSDLQEAIENDAKQMAGWLETLGHEVTPEQLVIDFFDRI